MALMKWASMTLTSDGSGKGVKHLGFAMPAFLPRGMVLRVSKLGLDGAFRRGLGNTWALVILACAFFAPACAAADTTLPKAHDLAAESRAAAAAGKAYLLLFAETGCEWCERARSTHLLPMEQDEKMRAKVVMRQIDIDQDTPLKDFAGRMVSHRRFAEAQGMRLYPTVALYGPDGRQTADRLTGFSNADYYGFSVERRIDAAVAALPKR